MHEGGRGLSVQLRQAGPIPLSVEFDCQEGEMLALIGPSGAGKTTILRAIAGLFRPQSGHVQCGQEVWLDTATGADLPPYRRRVGMVFQSYALFPHMTALANVATALGHRPRAERAAWARKLLRFVNNEGLEERKPATLSGGQQQRVAVARALARDPAVLLLDEPFSAVDRHQRRRLQRELQGLRTQLKIPILLVTHDLDEAAALADRLCVIDRGETLQTGRPADLLAAPANDRVRNALDISGEVHDRHASRQFGGVR
jgi:molybdate transport system ATP-binding protein